MWLTNDVQVDASVASGRQFKVDSTPIDSGIGAPDGGQGEPRSVAAPTQGEVGPDAEDFGIRPVASFIQRMLPRVETGLVAQKYIVCRKWKISEGKYHCAAAA